MNTEETQLEKLKDLCRLCFNKGELNIFEHQVPTTLCNETKDDQNFEYPATELFKIFNNCEVLLNEELNQFGLICYCCFEELTNCYLFYLKAERANKQMQELYAEAQKMEVTKQNDFQEQETEIDQFDEIQFIEVSVDEWEECNDNAIKNEVNTSLEDRSPENISTEPIELYEHFLPTEFYNEDEERKEGGIEQFFPLSPTDTFNENVVIASPAIQNVHDMITKSPEPKRVRLKQSREKCKKLPHEDSSYVITQFLPETSHVVVTNCPSPANISGDTVNAITSTLDLNTVDYAAVEVKSSSFEQIIEEDTLFQNQNTGLKNKMEECVNLNNEHAHRNSSSKVYVCKYCPQAFAAPHYLIAHTRKSHVCKYCTESFKKSTDLFVHIRQQHHQHKCAICSKEFSSPSNLRGHIKRVHGIRLPAQVALLDYHPPAESAVEENLECFPKQTNVDDIDDIDIYF